MTDTNPLAQTLRDAAQLMREQAQDCGGLSSGWSPAVADAVADWLDDTAAWFESDDLYGPAEIECALAVANAYLAAS